MILGTAGHIDHGKTALVRALTGVDTDRLPEEKRRGITIDLGFAPLHLPDDVVVGVVDVPGHEAFVRTMLAGATGIDVALLVIAADEGPMPQTREHLAILQLLEIPQLIVALTKADLVDAEWRTLVTEDVRELLRDTPFSRAEIVPTSVVGGEGLDLLRDVLLTHVRLADPRVADDLFRLPVDRAFSVKGTGTVVTGTVWSGELSVDDSVRIMPAGKPARVRGLQHHGRPVRTITPGMRAAVALASIETESVGRGATIVTLDAWESTLSVRADLTLLSDAPELRPRTRVRFHLATADVGARVVAVGSPVSSGTARPVRIVLDEPIMARTGDRFVLRSASPLATIGGGVITDSNAPRRARPMAALALPASSHLELFVVEAGGHGVFESTLPVRLGVPPSRARELSLQVPTIARVGDRLYASAFLEGARMRLLELVRAHHERRPLDSGAPRQEIRSRVGVDAPVFDHLVNGLASERRLESSGAELRISGWAPGLSDRQRKLTNELVSALDAAGHEPPSVSELVEQFGPETPALLRHLEREGRLVQVEEGRYYTPAAVSELLRRLEGGMAGKGELAPTDLRELLGFSRKYLIPFLEYCDRRGFTARQGSGRIWRGAKTQ